MSAASSPTPGVRVISSNADDGKHDPLPHASGRKRKNSQDSDDRARSKIHKREPSKDMQESVIALAFDNGAIKLDMGKKVIRPVHQLEETFPFTSRSCRLEGCLNKECGYSWQGSKTSAICVRYTEDNIDAFIDHLKKAEMKETRLIQGNDIDYVYYEIQGTYFVEEFQFYDFDGIAYEIESPST